MAKPTVSTTFNAVDKISKPINKMQANVKKFAAVAGAALATGAITRGFRSIVTEASKIEDATASFTPLMGGVEKANQLVAELNKTAASTPFQFDQIASASKQLLPVMNQDIEQTVSTFRMLGDTAGGNAQKLDSITRGFTKAMLKGKVDLESLNMISEAGVPIFDQLAQEIGVSTAEMFKMVSAGKVTTDQLTNTFEAMTSEGGIFFKGMEIASQTLTGRLSTLKDNINLTQAAIGTQLLPTIKPLIDSAIQAASKIREWVEANQELINQKIQDTINGITKAVKFVVSLWNSGLIPAVLAGVAAFKAINGAIALYKGALVAAKAVQIAFNVALAANPIGLAVTAIAALVAGVVLLAKNLEPVRDWFLKIGELIGPIFEKIGVITSKVGKIFGDDTAGFSEDEIDRQRERNPFSRPAISANQGAIDNQRAMTQQITRTSRSSVDVNLNNLPNGSTVRQKGQAEGVTLNYGYQTGRM